VSQVNPYASIEKRSFESALMRLLLSEYGLAGGRRIAMLLVEDVQKLIAEFYPDLGQAASGTLIWTCTADEGKKAEAGKPTEEYRTITLKLPLIRAEELRSWTEKRSPSQDSSQKARVRERAQVARLIQAAAEQGGLLTLAEVSVIVNRSYAQVARYVQEWQQETGELLPLKGYRMDQGASPTHKGEITRLYEQGLEPPDIAHQTGHSLKSVERYLQDYQRVKMLLRDHKNAEEISILIGRGRTVVLQYMQIAQKFHPELFQGSA
jgi:hypothetical protein